MVVNHSLRYVDCKMFTLQSAALFLVASVLLSVSSCNEHSHSASNHQSAAASETLFPVMSGRRMGYIDSNGRIAISPKFDVAADFRDNLARVSLNGKTGFIDDNGREVIPIELEGRILDYSEGFAPFGDIGKMGYLDKRGQIAIAPRFEICGYFVQVTFPHGLVHLLC
ncbi:MAG: hypothetical protein GDA68_23490 [Nitrospira sp. CR2.1]|nr:hypothetical protein [Nitrospira sp. CR2.1]